MIELTAKSYKETLLHCYETKDGLLLLGAPGIGKSEIPRQVFMDLAQEKNKEFVLWDKSSKEKKMEMLEDPGKYFVFCDQRLSQMDTTDLRGIPKMDGDYLDAMPPLWVIYFTNPDSDGLIFFDEINLATPIVVGSAYQIIHDRSIADRKISDNVLMIAAGNRPEDKAFTFDLPLPLRDRFCEAHLIVDAQAWIEWAISNKINTHLISFINWKESYLYRLSELSVDKSTTPRGVVRASRMLGKMDITTPLANMYISLAVGESFAREFQAYIKYYAELDWKVIFRDPVTIRSFETDKLFAVAGGLVEIFSKDNDKFEDICRVAVEMKDEYAMFVLKMIKEGYPKVWKRKASKSPTIAKTLGPRLGKYIIDSVE